MNRAEMQMLWVAVFLFQSILMTSQTLVNVRGVVTSEQEREPLIGVNAVVLGSQIGVVTDYNGAYSLEALTGDTIRFSYIGYLPYDHVITQAGEVDIRLEEESEVLQEVMVTGYRKEIKSDVATAITSVKSEDIEKMAVLGIDQALQGQAPGVMVTQTTGAPGDDIAVRIRGVGTIGNNNPLYVIDGIPTTDGINMFSTKDIESVQVLKDGASASIYGSRAANGVVLITTKKGRSGQAKFTFDASVGLQQANRLPELLNASDYLAIRNEAIENANELRIPIRQIDPYDPAILDTLPDTDWLDLMFNDALLHRYSLSASGGNENGRFFILGEYLNQEGVFRGQGFEKYLIRFNGETGNNWFKVGNNISFSATDRDVINSSGDGFGAGNELSGIRYTTIAAPVVPVRYPDGSYVNVTSELGDPTLYGDGNANPLAFVDATDWTIKRHRFFGSVFAEVTPVENLNIRTTLGVDLLFENGKLFKSRLSQAIYDPSSLTESRVTNSNIIWNSTIDYSRQFGRLNTSILLGTEIIQNDVNYLAASANNFFSTDPLFHYIDNSVAEDISNLGASGIESQWALVSYFGQIGFSFDRRYVLNASVRRDGSSRFGEDNRWGVFPSVSAAWNVANEAFLSDQDVLSTFKLRASWGKLGNQEIGNYPFSSLVQTGEFVYPFGNQIATGATLVETGNSNIKWESTTQLDFGLELGFLGDRLTVVVDYFQKNTDDMLVRIPVPQAGGSQNPPYVNAGEVENKGWEFGAIWKGRGKDFTYSIGANLATIKNQVVSLADSEPILGGFGLSDGPITRTEVGYPIGSFYLYEMEGLFQSQEEIESSAFQSDDTRPGDVKFADLNNDGVIDDSDRDHFGSPFPDFTYGLNISLNWKNLDFSILGQGVQGNDVYFLYGNFAYEVQARGFNSYRDILNRWTPENTDTEIPIVSIDDRNGNRRLSTRWLEDGSYFRIRNITLGYDFKDLLGMEAIGALRFYLSVQNAVTLTKYPGLDPEIQANTNDTQGVNIASDLAVGIDWGTVPAPRTIIGGVRIDF